MPKEAADRPVACERCHARKARCDKLRPACTSCVKANKTCAYIPKESPIRRQDMDRLQQQVHLLQSRNTELLHQLAQVQDQSQGHSTSESQPSYSSPPLNDAGGNAEVVEQVSYLSLSAAGERQFLGSTSGLLLANLLQNNLQPSTLLLPQGGSRAQPPRPTLGRRSREDPTGSHQPSSRPTKELARKLVVAYCNHDHLAYPFLDTKALFAALDAIYCDETPDSDHPIDCFFLDMVLAIGTAHVYKFDWLVLPDAETHYNRAVTRFAAVFAHGGITSLQAVLFLAQYRMGSSLYDTSASLWHLIGVAARMCFELGLHKRSTYLIPQIGGGVIDGAHKEKMEIMQRCFWCVVAMDRIVSFTLGRPLAIQLDDIDVELPHTDTHDFEASRSEDPVEDAVENLPPQLRTLLFDHIVRYRLICGKMLVSLHRDAWNARIGVDYQQLRHDLSQELESWKNETTWLPLLAADVTPDTQSNSSFRSREWYDLLYHNGILMLFRPSPTISDASHNSTTLQHIFHSSQASINLYAELHRSRNINYSWVTLHAVFVAGLSYIYALRCHFQNLWRPLMASSAPRAELVSTPTIHQVVNDTRACSNVLVAVSERWSTARSCSRVFDRLSDAVLADFLDTQTRRPASSMPALIPPQDLGDRVMLDSSTLTDMSDAVQDANMTSSLGPMAVDNTFQDCFDDLQNWWNDQYGGDAITQLSQNWLSGIQDPGSLNTYF